MRVEPSTRGRATERDPAEARQRVVDAGLALAYLRRVARELLAERHGNSVHQVRPPRLDDVVELGGLRRQRLAERIQRRQQVARQTVERGKVDGGREDVV